MIYWFDILTYKIRIHLYTIRSLYCRHEFYWQGTVYKDNKNTFDHELHRCEKCYKYKNVYEKTVDLQTYGLPKK